MVETSHPLGTITFETAARFLHTLFTIKVGL